jgi:6-pyruvoyltetrahydropterin/6-carboxytetrahydropterin synthase
MELFCDFHYDSAHRLPYVPDGHKCGRLHGHTYHLTVVVDGPVRDDGFVVDFAEVKDAVKPVIDRLDHYYLNEVEGLENPTVEVQLPWLWDRINLPGLCELRLREGESNAAAYRGAVPR